MTSHDLSDRFGMLSHEEIDLLKKCVRMLPPKPLVVITGAGPGTASLAILEANPLAFIFSIDKREQPGERENLLAAGVEADRVVRILADSGHIQGWPFPVDMALIDGDHTPDGVRADIETWKPLVEEFGIMLFHDYAHWKITSVTPVVDELMAGYKVVGKERFLIAYRMS